MLLDRDAMRFEAEPVRLELDDIGQKIQHRRFREIIEAHTQSVSL